VKIIRDPVRAGRPIRYEYSLPLIPLLEQLTGYGAKASHLGRLSLKEEAAGKIRVFAMVDA